MFYRSIKLFSGILFGLALFLFLSSAARAQDCPRGLVNDPAPGICGLYVDENNDGFCDLSEEKIVPLQSQSSSIEPQTNAAPVATKDYYMWELTLAFTLIYLLSLFLVKKGYLSRMVNRKIWNMLLLISFVVTVITSVLVLLRLNYGLPLSLYTNMVFLHVEVGYVMILISICHTLWHTAYFKTYFK